MKVTRIKKSDLVIGSYRLWIPPLEPPEAIERLNPPSPRRTPATRRRDVPDQRPENREVRHRPWRT